MEHDEMVAAIPGFGLVPFEDYTRDRTRESDPSAAVIETRRQLSDFMLARDTVAFLARVGLYFLINAHGAADLPLGTLPMEQIEVEILQVLALTQARGPAVFFNPQKLERISSTALRNIRAFSDAYAPDPDVASPEEVIAHEVRIQTLYYRNIFSSDEAKRVVPALLARTNDVSMRQIGFKLSDFSRACFAIFDLVGERVSARLEHVRDLVDGRNVDAHVVDLCASAPRVRRAWRIFGEHLADNRERGLAGFQLSEFAWSPAFTFGRSELVRRFGGAITDALFRCAIRFEELAGSDLDQLYLANPIHARPFVRLDEDTLFIPIPGLLVSFPFDMIEHLIGADGPLNTSYIAARTKYLEDAVAEEIAASLPSARVHPGVKWKDPDSGKTYETDVVALIGNHILLFEAKSGRLSPAARRGGLGSLREKLAKLYVAANDQAARLEMVLARDDATTVVLRDRNGIVLDLDLTTPKIV